MAGKRIVCEESFWQLFPQAEIGVLVMDDVPATDDVAPEMRARAAELVEEGNRLAAKWLTETQVSQNEVVAVWRDAYRRFAGKKGARSSVENLLKRVANGRAVGSIVPTVDVTNYISLKHALPIGVENLDAIQGDLRLKVCEGGDPFVPIGSDEDDPTLEGELAYVDDEGAVCRNWNWRDGKRTAAGDDTPHCVAIVECVDPSRSAALHEAMEELAALVQDVLGARVVSLSFLTDESREADLA